MKNLTRKIISCIIPGMLAFNAGNVFGQNGSKADSIYNSIKNHKYDSSYVVLDDRNKDKIIDKVIYMYYYPKICLKMSSLDNNYDGFFETTTESILYENSWIDLKESGNLDYISRSFKNFPPKKYESRKD